MNQIDKTILDILKKENNCSISRKLLISKVHKIDSNIPVKDIFNSIFFLNKKGYIKILNNQKVVIGYQDGNIINNQKLVGKIAINQYSDGYLKDLQTNETIAYINKKNINDALDGDFVECLVFDKKSKENIVDAKVNKVLERKQKTIVCCVVFKNKHFVFIPDEPRILQTVKVTKIDSDLKHEDKVIIKIDLVNADVIKGSIIKNLGNKNLAGNDILSIVYANDINPEFSNELLNKTNKITREISNQERSKRKDLTNLCFITIDPEHSKDLDDAIYVEKINDKNYKLYVAIADVSHFLGFNTDLDHIGFERSTSIYLIDQVIPMLPNIITNDICSLNPDCEKLTIVCEMEINVSGEINKIDVYDAIIINKKRLSYDQVNNYFENKIEQLLDLKIKKVLDQSYELFKILDRKFKQRGYIDFKISEPKIVLDSSGKAIDVYLYKTKDAQNMIEFFMVSANEAVTIKANQLQMPFIYRVHDKPNEKKLNSFLCEAKKINFVVSNDINDIKSNTISKWIDNNANHDFNLINRLLLRTMAKAEYSVNNIGHFGLASNYYTHFTSPIRRYPDVVVHQLYKMFYLRKNEFNEKQRNLLVQKLETICTNCSLKEQKAIEIEREVNSYKFCEYMQNKIGQEFIGIISYVVSFGIFIELENSIEGLCKIPNIKIDDFFIFDDQGSQYVGQKTKTILTFGTKVKIRLINVDLKLKQIDFEIISLL